MEIKKLKNIPKQGAGRPLKYPFDSMKPLECLEFPVKTKLQRRAFYCAYAAARQYAKRQKPKWQFCARIVHVLGMIIRKS